MEGRDVDEFERRCADYAALVGKPKAAVYSEIAKREFGYESNSRERELWDLRHEISSRANEEEEREHRRFAEAIATLPTQAPLAAEIEWVRSHPAMTRRQRSGERGPLVLTAEDVLDPANGPAPSQSAVQQLQVWSDKPAEFFKMCYSGKTAVGAAVDSLGKSAAESIESERQTIDQALGVLESLNKKARDLAAQAIGLEL